MSSTWSGYLTVCQDGKESDLILIDRQSKLLLCTDGGSPEEKFPFELPKWQPEPEILMFHLVSRDRVSEKTSEAADAGKILCKYPIRLKCKSLDGYVKMIKLRRNLDASKKLVSFSTPG